MKTNTPKELQQLKDKTFILTITLAQKDIDHTYHHVLEEVQAEFETKGFRKGKAPLDVVEANVSRSKMIEEVLSHLLSDIYSQKITEYHLHPVVQPQIKILNPPVTFDKDWQVEITGCELPEITIDSKYLEEIKAINQIQKDDNERLNQTIESLVKNSQVDIPNILIQADLNNKMSQLVDQTQQAGLTVSQYLKSKDLTIEKYQENLEKQIKNEWITNLAIDFIAKDQKLTVTEAEVKAITDKNQQLAENINMVYYLLTQQKVFDYLKNL